MKPLMKTGAVIGVLVAIGFGAGCQRREPLPEDPLPAVRDLIAKQDFTSAEALLTRYRTELGTTPALVDGMSVLALRMSAAGLHEPAEELARTTHELASALLMARPVDEEPRAPLALGRAIEIRAQATARRGDTAEALRLLNDEMGLYRGTSVEKRIQRNINLLEMEGQTAPALDLSEHLSAAAPPLDALKGQVVVLFFWAHYCADCKAQAPVLAKVADKYRGRGLVVVAPTQRYGYVAEGQDAPPDVEARYIDEVRREHYAALAEVPIPLSDANHRRYGVSSTPTLVLIGRDGRVARYHPGVMSEAELDTGVRALVEEAPRKS